MSAREGQQIRKEIREAIGERRERDVILVVEDDPDVREALRLLLGKKFEVVGMSSGEGFRKALGSYKPVLAILDVNLPGKNGFELCREIRSSPDDRSIPVLFLTARRDDETFRRFVMSNADAFLNKPFEKKELDNTVQRLIGTGIPYL